MKRGNAGTRDAGKGGDRYAKVFAKLAKEGRGAFIPFVVLGDPNFAASARIVEELSLHADCLELGFPFSDPIADGKRIQAADQRALDSGMTVRKCFEVIRRVRAKNPAIPIGLLLYYNLVHRHGPENFLRKAKACGADAVLVADMPLEESADLNRLCSRLGLKQVFTVSPLTTGKRLERITAKSRGFLYIVSVLGVTGERRKVSSLAIDFVKRLRRTGKGRKARLCVGFGISKPEHARELFSGGADGVIVGSAIEAIIEENAGNGKATLAKIAEFASAMKGAMVRHA